MKIIDAHFHMFPATPFGEARLKAIGHEPGFPYLQEYYKTHGFVHGVIMGNGSTDPKEHQVPKGFHYCIGLDYIGDDPDRITANIDNVEKNLQLPQCCGVKLYAGYSSVSINDPHYQPVYELAEHYGKPVAVHMGQTAHPHGVLRTSHPLNLDQAAVEHPRIQFVMCHFGNPFLADAAAVIEKNPNVAADLSGLLEGVKDLDSYFEEQAAYVMMLRGWMAYVEDWSRFMFGTDFPAVNLQNYADFCMRLIPERHRDAFFFDNANRIYQLGL